MDRLIAIETAVFSPLSKLEIIGHWFFLFSIFRNNNPGSQTKAIIRMISQNCDIQKVMSSKNEFPPYL